MSPDWLRHITRTTAVITTSTATATAITTTNNSHCCLTDQFFCSYFTLRQVPKMNFVELSKQLNFVELSKQLFKA